jgi:hypothetical protein
VIDLAIQIAEALTAAHAKGIIHRAVLVRNVTTSVRVCSSLERKIIERIFWTR